MVQGEVPDDEPRRPRPRPEAPHGVDGRLLQAGIGGEPEVVVGAEVDELAAADGHDGPLRPDHGLEAAAQPLLLQGAELPGDPVQCLARHAGYPRTTRSERRPGSVTLRFQRVSEGASPWKAQCSGSGVGRTLMPWPVIISITCSGVLPALVR